MINIYYSYSLLVRFFASLKYFSIAACEFSFNSSLNLTVLTHALEQTCLIYLYLIKLLVSTGIKLLSTPSVKHHTFPHEIILYYQSSVWLSMSAKFTISGHNSFSQWIYNSPIIFKSILDGFTGKCGCI